MRVFSSFEKSTPAKATSKQVASNSAENVKKGRNVAGKAKAAAAPKKIEKPSPEEIREKVALHSKNKNIKTPKAPAAPVEAPSTPVPAAAMPAPAPASAPTPTPDAAPENKASSVIDVAKALPIGLPEGGDKKDEKEAVPPKTELLGDVRDNNPNSPETVLKLKEVLKSGGVQFNEREKNVLSQIINQ